MLGYGPNSPLKGAQINTTKKMKEFGFTPLEEFWRGIPALNTKRGYTSSLVGFFEYVRKIGELAFDYDLRRELKEAKHQYFVEKFPKLNEVSEQFKAKAQTDPKWVYWVTAKYFDNQKSLVNEFPREKRTSKAGTLYAKPHKAIVKFFEMNDIVVNWKRVDAEPPKMRSYANDRKIELPEIQSLLGHEDPRIRPIVLILVASGMDPAWLEFLQFKHIKPIFLEEGKMKYVEEWWLHDGTERIVAAEVEIYRDKTDSHFFGFITPEAFSAVREYIRKRSKAGESPSVVSPILRNRYYHYDKTLNQKRAHASPTEVRPLRYEGILEVIKDGLWATGNRTPLREGETRHEFQATKSFRKYFTTALDNVRPPIPEHIKKMLRGDSVGRIGMMTTSYHRPTVRDMHVPFASKRELLEEYLRALPDLTILPENIKDLNMEETLEERLQENLKGRDQRIEVLEAELASTNAKFDLLSTEVKRSIERARSNRITSSRWQEDHRNEAEEYDEEWMSEAERVVKGDLEEWANTSMGKVKVGQMERDHEGWLKKKKPENKEEE